MVKVKNCRWGWTAGRSPCPCSLILRVLHVGVSEIGVHYFGVLIIRILLFRVLYVRFKLGKDLSMFQLHGATTTLPDVAR